MMEMYQREHTRKRKEINLEDRASSLESNYGESVTSLSTMTLGSTWSYLGLKSMTMERSPREKRMKRKQGKHLKWLKLSWMTTIWSLKICCHQKWRKLVRVIFFDKHTIIDGIDTTTQTHILLWWIGIWSPSRPESKSGTPMVPEVTPISLKSK